MTRRLGLIILSAKNTLLPVLGKSPPQFPKSLKLFGVKDLSNCQLLFEPQTGYLFLGLLKSSKLRSNLAFI